MKRLLFISILFLLSVAIQAQVITPWKYTPKTQTDSIKVSQYFMLNNEVFKITSAADDQILQRKLVLGKHIWTNVSSTSLGYDSLRFDSVTGYIRGYKGGTSNSASSTQLDGRYTLIQTFNDSIAVLRGLISDFMTKSVYDTAGVNQQLVGITAIQTISNKTLTQPAISDFTLAQHPHASAATGGILNSDVISEGSVNLFSPFTESSGNLILSSGNMGLGVSPTTKLDVNGTTKTTSLNLATSLTFDGTTITDIQTGTGTNIALATKNYVDDQIISAGGYTDEQAQDAVGGALDNGTIGDVVFTYNDATPKISGVVEDDSHTHTGTTISGLDVSNFTSPNISNWTNNSNYLTSSYALTNDLGGTLSNPAVIDDSHNHTISTLPNLVSSVDGVTNDGGDIDLVASGIVSITPNDIANTITIGATEVDGSVTNEIQNLGYTASTRVLSIDGTGSTDATLPLFSDTEPGLVPLSGGGTSNFLRADGTWAAVGSSSGDITSVTAGLGLSGGGTTGDVTVSLLLGELSNDVTATTSDYIPWIDVGTSNDYKMTIGTLQSLIGVTGFADPMTTRGDIIYRNASNVTARLGRGTAGQVLSSNGTDISWTTPSTSSGTVTSVGLSLPSIFSVTGSPVTTTGTLTASLASQTANGFFGSPNGSSGTPSFRKVYAADMAATGTPSSTTYLRGDNTWSTISSTGIDNTLYATIKNISATGGFQLAHALLVHGDYLYVGERINDATPTEIARIIKYDINTLAEVSSYSVGANLDVESMAYDSINNRIYAVKQNASQLEIMSINPSTMALDGAVHTYAGIISGLSPAIVTDGTYIYGVTYTSPSTFFKINISTWASSATAIWTSRERGHAAKINTRTGYMYCTTIPSSSATDPYFAKVALSNLAYTEVNIGTYVKKATDDFAMIDDGSEVYCIVGGEYDVSGYNGVQVKTSDLTLTGFKLKTTYAVSNFGNVCYSTSIDGTIQAFNRYDLNNVQTYKLNGYYGNELVTNFQGRVITTNFDAYDETKGKVIEVLLLGDGYDYKYPDVTAGSGTGGWTSYSGYVAPSTISDEVRIGSTTDNGDYKLQVSSTGNGSLTTVTSGIGLFADATTGTGAMIQSQSGTALSVTSLTGTPASIDLGYATSTNTMLPILKLNRLSSGAGASGIGGNIEFYNEVSSGGQAERAGTIGIRSTNVTPSGVAGEFVVGISSAGVVNDALKVTDTFIMTCGDKIMTAMYNLATTNTTYTTTESTGTVIITGTSGSITLDSTPFQGQMHTIVNQSASARTISSFTGFGGFESSIAANSSITLQYYGTTWYRIR